MKKWKPAGKIIASLVIFILLLLFVLPFFIPIPELENTVDPKQLADADSRFVIVDGIEIHYKAKGEGKPDLILMHGLGSSVVSWQRVMNELSKIGTVTAYDRPAFGLTERILPDDYHERNPYSRRFQPLLLAEFMNQLDIKSAVLVGNSAGGTLAVQMALMDPERVDALILVDPAVLTLGGPSPFLNLLIKLPSIDRIGPLIARNSGSMAQNFVQRAYHDPSKIAPEIMEDYLKPMRVNHWDRAFWEFVKAAEPMDLASRLNEIDLPVLVITGDDDRIVPTEESIRLAGLIKNAQLVIIPECGHVPQEECPEAFIMAVEEFLNDLDRIE